MDMEELIWKYLDNDCSEQEKVKVENLLKSDHAFNLQFNDLKNINQLFVDHTSIPLPSAFKVQLETNIAAQLKKRTVKRAEIISTQWIAILTLVGVGVIAAISSVGSSSFIFEQLPAIDEKIIDLIAWTFLGFLLLVGLDSFLSTGVKIKKTTLFMV